MVGRRANDTGPDLFGQQAAPTPAPAAAKQRAPSEPPPELTGVRRYARVALNRPISTEYTYGIPPELEERALPGARVAVPFGPRREVGVVVGVDDDAGEAAGRVKLLARVLDEDGPIVGEELLELTRWMAEEYACAWGEALAAVLPAGLKRERKRRTVKMACAALGVGEVELASLEDPFPKQHRLLRTLIETGGDVELRDLLRRLNLSDSAARTLERKGLITIEKVVVESDALLIGRGDRPRHANLSEHQALAVTRICELLDQPAGGTVLLRGVTGSGKTEVYLRAIEARPRAERGAIVLVPEIALTPQTVGWFRSRFGSVAVLHSEMTDAQRLDMWLRVRRGEARVVVGARSALFAPVRDLGVIVVDEEHEPSFKQGNVPRYHARDVAVSARGHGRCRLRAGLGDAGPGERRASGARRVRAARAPGARLGRFLAAGGRRRPAHGAGGGHLLEALAGGSWATRSREVSSRSCSRTAAGSHRCSGAQAARRPCAATSVTSR